MATNNKATKIVRISDDQLVCVCNACFAAHGYSHTVTGEKNVVWVFSKGLLPFHPGTCDEVCEENA